MERTVMRYLLAVAALALALPGLAAAKGPESASISGPGLDRSLPITGAGEMGSGTPLGALVDAGGFFAQMYGQSPDPTLPSQPNGTLGPSFRITYVVPGPNGIRSRVIQQVYPYAKPSPVSYMAPGQSFWGNKTTSGGWFRAPADLKKMLVSLGLPATAPRANAGSLMDVIGPVTGGVVALIMLVAVARASRRRGWRPLRAATRAAGGG
jgi:hypothetical protein